MNMRHGRLLVAFDLGSSRKEPSVSLPFKEAESFYSLSRQIFDRAVQNWPVAAVKVCAVTAGNSYV